MREVPLCTRMAGASLDRKPESGRDWLIVFHFLFAQDGGGQLRGAALVRPLSLLLSSLELSDTHALNTSPPRNHCTFM